MSVSTSVSLWTFDDSFIILPTKSKTNQNSKFWNFWTPISTKENSAKIHLLVNCVPICFPTLWIVWKKWRNTNWENIQENKQDVNIVLIKVRIMWICANTFREGIAEFTRKLETCKNCIRVNCVNILGRLLEQNANICRTMIDKILIKMWIVWKKLIRVGWKPRWKYKFWRSYFFPI